MQRFKEKKASAINNKRVFAKYKSISEMDTNIKKIYGAMNEVSGWKLTFDNFNYVLDMLRDFESLELSTFDLLKQRVYVVADNYYIEFAWNVDKFTLHSFIRKKFEWGWLYG